MKLHKGTAGYISAKKRQLAFIIGMVAVIAILLLAAGYFVFDTRLNILSVLAVIICIPICRTLVNLIMLIPHHTVSEQIEMELSAVTEDLTVLYDLVITSEKKAMQVDALVISPTTICGYTSLPQTDTEYASVHIKNMLAKNNIEKMTVKIFKDYTAFKSRAEGMENIVSVQHLPSHEREEEIAQIIQDISL